MKITPPVLLGQHDRARISWPYIDDVCTWFGLPPKLLYAVGSRETNLTNEIGDGGHGFGIWQRDNRSWSVNATYLHDVHGQAVDAAALLARDYAKCGTWAGACSMYNCGSANDRYTTGGDYGADCMGRLSCLVANRVRIALPTMGPSNTGNAVRLYQTACNAKHFAGCPIKVDGDYGPATEAVTRRFQQSHGLGVDGVAGPVTLAVMATMPMPK